MSNCVPFHTQLASIMEVLAKAAVAEICELVDDGYAVLHLEISRKQKENEALKKKLHMMEMRLARGSIQKTQAREVTVDIRSSDGVPVFSELTLRGAASVPVDDFPAIDGLFSKQPSISLWRDGETSSVNGVQSPLHSVTRDEAAVMEEEVPESLVIKEERLDEDLESSDSQRGININEDRAVDSDSSERIPILDTQTVPAPGSEELSEQHRTRPGVWDEGGLDAGLKAEPEIKTVNLQDTAGRLNRLGNEYVLYERPSQLDTFFTQKTIENETRGHACSYTANPDSESLSAHTELQIGSTTVKDGDKVLPSLRSLNGMDSLPFEEEAGIHPGWNKESLSGSMYTPYRHNRREWETEKLQAENVSNIFSAHTQVAPKDNMVISKSKALTMTSSTPCDESFTTSLGMKCHRKSGTRARRFICTFCGKSFTSPQNLETHIRVHTGERPFSCAQCGKRFTQSGHLKTHQSVHTGDRPFMCTHCGKRFAGKQNLRIHQQRNHPAESNVG